MVVFNNVLISVLFNCVRVVCNMFYFKYYVFYCDELMIIQIE
jgi:hypothetical protein